MAKGKGRRTRLIATDAQTGKKTSFQASGPLADYLRGKRSRRLL